MTLCIYCGIDCPADTEVMCCYDGDRVQYDGTVCPACVEQALEKVGEDT